MFLIDTSYENLHYDNDNFYITFPENYAVWTMDADNSGSYVPLSADTNFYIISANSAMPNAIYENSIYITCSENDLFWSKYFPGDLTGSNAGLISNNDSNWYYYKLLNLDDSGFNVERENPNGETEDHNVKWRNTVSRFRR